ncbi:MAG: heavy metal translocating P-type ATPase [Sandaracinaceae bacterium]
MVDAASNAPTARAAGIELEYDVEGMTCAACARRVEKALTRAEGVTSARVDLVRERAVIVLADPALASRAKESAETAVDKAGYRLRARDVEAKAASGRAREVRTLSAWVLTVLAFATGLAGQPWLEAVLASLVVVVVGAPILRKAALDVAARTAGMDVLIAVGAGAALVASWSALVAHAGHAMGSHGHSDASMAALIVAVTLLGKSIERRAKARAGEAIEAIVRAMPRTARVIRHGVEGEVPLAEVRAGDEVRVGPFSRVPVDGEILADEEVGAGAAPIQLDESVVTGESRPVERRAGMRALGGSLSLGRGFRMRVTSVGEDTELARVAYAVSRAQATKTAVVRTTDRIAGVFAPLVLLVAVLTAVGWWLAGAPPSEILRTAIAVVVVACPCALGLATPVAITVAMGNLAGRGILVRDATVLEALPRVRTLVLDKTGTLTEGTPRVVAIVRAVDAADDEDALLALAASVENESHHPIARAIFEEAMRRGLVVPHATEVEERAGEGVSGAVSGRRVSVGRASAAHDARFELTERAREALRGASVAELVIDGRPAARLFLEDALRPEAGEVVGALRARGLALAIRSGDSEPVVRAVASRLGIEDARGGQRPEEKLRDLESLPGPVAMIGDGINDAPARARAAVGFALGTRAQTALEAAGVALPRPDLGLVLHALDVSARALAIIRQNLVLAFAYNVVAIPFAAVGAFERLGGPAAAAVAMAASSLLVVLNALRLRDRSRAVSAVDTSPQPGIESAP